MTKPALVAGHRHFSARLLLKLGVFVALLLSLLSTLFAHAPATASASRASSAHKLFLFVQGIDTDFSSDDAAHNRLSGHIYSFDQPGGIVPRLAKTEPGATLKIFSYNGLDRSGHPQPYACQDTFTQHLSVYVNKLQVQVTNYLNTYPDTNIYVIGHSLGVP
ncbi:hypothetical protein EPA93_38155 [Ktedonosporobacter rubrisoli]|uniref:Uncharacterized protein n=1 Tax=Ktedonosporobacter rubrisoli TaxID=2509675 RepID=A0A4P6K0C8_KTERU|nr:hypothetical protein [Ktedonosporobacter rubrisoli]QBD81484.1 hypothetical protein EPA93_38155 [Ktedonosporobacter rubrisoli]